MGQEEETVVCVSQHSLEFTFGKVRCLALSLLLKAAVTEAKLNIASVAHPIYLSCPPAFSCPLEWNSTTFTWQFLDATQSKTNWQPQK